jgi:hypothetical protein
MNRVFSFILIPALLFPLFGQAFAAAAPATPSVQASVITIQPDQKTIIAALKDIYTRLNSLSSQTQVAINQLNGNGVVTDQAQADLISANTVLAKAKVAIDKLTPQTGPDTFKAGVIAAEASLKEGRTDILTSLSDLKATLPSL